MPKAALEYGFSDSTASVAFVCLLNVVVSCCQISLCGLSLYLAFFNLTVALLIRLYSSK